MTAPNESAALPPAAGSTSILLLLLRRMRAPLITLIAVYAVSILGLTLVPGVTAGGEPAPPMSFFHAFYFISYTASTIGFGEIPAAFSDAQRMWVTVVIYLSVIGWSYSILTLLALFQDAGFHRAVATIRFERRVRRIGEPFFLILGCGDTGLRLIRALDRRDLRFAVVEKSEARIAELELEDFRTDAPVLCADASSPQALQQAGLTHPRCAAALALTDDEHANLAVAAAARLLNPKLPVLARTHSPRNAANLRSFGVEHAIDPFETFAQHLVLAMREPGCYRLLDWLTATSDSELQRELEPPRGTWIVCGYGRFGRAIAKALAAQGLSTRIVDPAPDAGLEAAVAGIGTEREVLERAGVEAAAGLVAATDDDIANLAVIAMARELNPRLFVVARQSESVNQPLFERIRADIVMRPSEIVAEEALARLTTPLLDRFLDAVRAQSDAWADEVIHQLRERIGTRAPKAWAVTIDAAGAPAVADCIARGGRPLALGELTRDPLERSEPLPARALLVLRAGRQTVMPPDDFELAAGDRILFAGRGDARRRMASTLANANTLEYLRTGRDAPGGWVWKKLAERTRQA